MSVDIEKARREEARWRILKGLDAGRPYPVSEAVLLRLLTDLAFPCTPLDLRRELDYLRDRKLVAVTGEADNDWRAELTRYGVDVVEYTIPCEPGIARPQHNRGHR